MYIIYLCIKLLLIIHILTNNISYNCSKAVKDGEDDDAGMYT